MTIPEWRSNFWLQIYKRSVSPFYSYLFTEYIPCSLVRKNCLNFPSHSSDLEALAVLWQKGEYKWNNIDVHNDYQLLLESRIFCFYSLSNSYFLHVPPFSFSQPKWFFVYKLVRPFSLTLQNSSCWSKQSSPKHKFKNRLGALQCLLWYWWRSKDLLSSELHQKSRLIRALANTSVSCICWAVLWNVIYR